MKPSSLSPMIVQSAMDYDTYSDDEHSTSSTVMVNSTSPKKTLSYPWMANPATPARKSVSFSPCAYEAQSPLVLEPADIQRLWWTPAELRQNREEKHERVKQIYHFDKSQERTSKAARHSFLSVLHRIFEACCEVRSECDRECVSQSDVQRFQLYIHAMDYRHGLERATSEMLANDKMGRRQYLVETILRLQKEWRHHLSPEMLEEFLRDASENVTRPSRLFARRLAAAHAFLPNGGNAAMTCHPSTSTSEMGCTR